MQFYSIEFGTPEYDQAVQLRYEILRRPLGLEFSPEDLAKEYSDYHLVAYDNAQQLIGYLCLTPLDDFNIKMRQVAIAQHVQGKGVGAGLVRYSEQFAKDNQYQKMVLSARETAVPFYLKLNYEIVGEPYEEVTIPHFMMEKILV